MINDDVENLIIKADALVESHEYEHTAEILQQALQNRFFRT